MEPNEGARAGYFGGTAASLRRGSKLVATWPRILAASAIGGAVAALLVALFVRQTGASGGRVGIVGGATALSFLISYAALGSSERRLARELRVARTGTAQVRARVLRRETTMPLVLRVLTTTLGTAAVRLADGDRSGALDALGADSALFSWIPWGGLGLLRTWVEGDACRASDVASEHLRAIQLLQSPERTGNREADRYRVHVLVKAVLEHADAATAATVLRDLERSTDDEERVYRHWLATWFELDEAIDPNVTTGELRLAALLARAHGASDLVAKLEARIAAADARG